MKQKLHCFSHNLLHAECFKLRSVSPVKLFLPLHFLDFKFDRGRNTAQILGKFNFAAAAIRLKNRHVLGEVYILTIFIRNICTFCIVVKHFCITCLCFGLST